MRVGRRKCGSSRQQQLWRFSVHFTYMATRQLSGDTTVNDLGHISRSLNSFTSNFSKTMCDTAKVTIGN